MNAAARGFRPGEPDSVAQRARNVLAGIGYGIGWAAGSALLAAFSVAAVPWAARRKKAAR